MDIEQRKEQFKKSVQDAGGLLYTKRMLEDFLDYWTEPNRAKSPKMRFELQAAWEVKRRLSTWARRTRDYQCFLTESQKTIMQKKRDFAISLEPYLEKYGRDMMNQFYTYWTQPENRPNPERIKFELENFWDVGTRLSQWASRNQPNPF